MQNEEKQAPVSKGNNMPEGVQALVRLLACVVVDKCFDEMQHEKEQVAK